MSKFPPLQSLQPCPFCNIPFKRLGNHLRHCSQRSGQDYTPYLSQKTLKKRQKPQPPQQQCQQCGRWWKRLDTHLRQSARCRLQETRPSDSMIPCHEQSPVSSHVPDSLERDESPPLSSAEPPLFPSLLRPFNCPHSKEEWAEADLHFVANVVPTVLSATTVDEKNRILCVRESTTILQGDMVLMPRRPNAPEGGEVGTQAHPSQS